MRVRVSWKEWVAILALLGVAAVIILPALSRARESARRASCANNLKQLGLVFKMFANEHKGLFPPLSPNPGNWIMDVNTVFPEYVSDLHIFICPDSPFAYDDTFTLRRTFDHPGANAGDMHPDCVSSLFYTYTGYTLLSDEQALALYEAFEQGCGEFDQAGNVDAAVPVWPGSGRTNGYGPEGIPVMWDRIPPTDPEFSHTPCGANILHHNGSVQFVPYSPYNTSNNFPVTRLTALTFGSSIPTLSGDCY
ncbi:MAG TPA: DUF1559 domain-containing protein [Candidatus Bathyarchaeia archaeon]|nr:DUF1559 domain-containing protein [Candidatus Bathyarchaeia archaeon]